MNTIREDLLKEETEGSEDRHGIDGVAERACRVIDSSIE